MPSLLSSPDVASYSGIGVNANPSNQTVAATIPKIGTDTRIFWKVCPRRWRAATTTTARARAIPVECERLVSNSNPTSLQNVGVSRHFSAPARRTSSRAQVEGNEEKQNYYVNTGHAIRTLREEIPAIFFREPTFDIYREDITFKDPLNTFVGIENYKLILWGLRIHGWIFFRALSVDIIGVWQPAENIIMIRWVVHGIPRVPWESHGRFDGTSEYKLDKTGKIFEHRVDNVATNSPPKFRVLSVEELVQALGCPSTARPTFFEMLRWR